MLGLLFRRSRPCPSACHSSFILPGIFKPWDTLLAHLARCGFAEVEGYGDPEIYDAPEIFRDPDAQAWPHHADRARFPIGDVRTCEMKKVVKIARTLGMHALYCPYVPPEEQPTSGTGWKAWGKRLAAVARDMREEGFAFGWHNHDFEFVKLKDGSFPT